MNNIYFVLGLIGVQIILPIRPQTRALNEDENCARRLLPDAGNMENL
jgi:hypothetical protein